MYTKNSSPVHRTAEKPTPCVAWKCSDTTAPQDVGTHREADLHLLSGGFFNQILVEMIDFSPQKAFLCLPNPPKQNHTKRAFQFTRWALRQSLASPASTTSNRIQQFHSRAGSILEPWTSLGLQNILWTHLKPAKPSTWAFYLQSRKLCRLQRFAWSCQEPLATPPLLCGCLL